MIALAQEEARSEKSIKKKKIACFVEKLCLKQQLGRKNIKREEEGRRRNTASRSVYKHKRRELKEIYRQIDAERRLELQQQPSESGRTACHYFFFSLLHRVVSFASFSVYIHTSCVTTFIRLRAFFFL